MSENDEIREMLLRIETDTSSLVDRVSRLEAEVSHMTGNFAETPRMKQKTDTVWTFGPNIKYNHV
jgi:predicted nuclease with TOPRIM domain